VFNFIKGADVALEDRLDKNSRLSDGGQQTLNDMNEMANQGLRTLIFAMKQLDLSLDYETA